LQADTTLSTEIYYVHDEGERRREGGEEGAREGGEGRGKAQRTEGAEVGELKQSWSIGGIGSGEGCGASVMSDVGMRTAMP